MNIECELCTVTKRHVTLLHFMTLMCLLHSAACPGRVSSHSRFSVLANPPATLHDVKKNIFSQLPNRSLIFFLLDDILVFSSSAKGMDNICFRCLRYSESTGLFATLTKCGPGVTWLLWAWPLRPVTRLSGLHEVQGLVANCEKCEKTAGKVNKVLYYYHFCIM